jgi:hypothetical protein
LRDRPAFHCGDLLFKSIDLTLHGHKLFQNLQLGATLQLDQAIDLWEIDDDDVRGEPIKVRKDGLKQLIRSVGLGFR